MNLFDAIVREPNELIGAFITRIIAAAQAANQYAPAGSLLVSDRAMRKQIEKSLSRDQIHLLSVHDAKTVDEINRLLELDEIGKTVAKGRMSTEDKTTPAFVAEQHELNQELINMMKGIQQEFTRSVLEQKETN